MSLILDALKKLERDQTAPDSGVVVVGALPWHGVKQPRRGRGLLGSLLVAALAVAAIAWWLGGTARAPVHRETSSTPAQLRPPTVATMTAAVSAEPPGAERGSTAERQPGVSMPAARAGVAPATPPTARRLVLPNPRAAAPIAAAAQDGAETSEGEARSAPANAAAPGRPAGDLQLMAISQRDGQPIAIIGDRLVHEGDSFDGFKVLRIGESEVEVEVRGRRRVLRF